MIYEGGDECQTEPVPMKFPESERGLDLDIAIDFQGFVEGRKSVMTEEENLSPVEKIDSHRSDVSEPDVQCGSKISFSSLQETAQEAINSSLSPKNLGKLRCPVCLDLFYETEMYTMSCTQRHCFCVDDIRLYVAGELSRKSVPACPMCVATRCPFSEHDVSRLFGEGSQELLLLRQASAVAAARAGPPQSRDVMPCPTPDCQEYIPLTPSEPNSNSEPSSNQGRRRRRHRVQCQACLGQFCSVCRERYHFRVPCKQVPKQRFFFSCSRIRTAHLSAILRCRCRPSQLSGWSGWPRAAPPPRPGRRPPQKRRRRRRGGETSCCETRHGRRRAAGCARTADGRWSGSGAAMRWCAGRIRAAATGRPGTPYIR